MNIQRKTLRRFATWKSKFTSDVNWFLKSSSVSLLVLLFISHVKAQKPLEITAGVGLPEVIYVGLRYNVDNTKWGFTLGGIPSGSSSLFTFGGDFYSHFGRNSDQMNGSTWFVNFGINHLKENSEYAIEKWLFLKGRIGRSFYLTPAASIDAGLGLMYEVHHKRKEKTTGQCTWFCFDFSNAIKVVPILSISFNVRI